ncbi:hypothetical protein CLOP_g22059 [Closterium sp. NIES-67]|nr:hypothetical protein CLOP_g22059 [Closterium sp. NIES-67]
MAGALSLRARSPALRWFVLAVVLKLAGTAGTATLECRDGSAEKAVVVTTFHYDQVSFPVNFYVQLMHPYEVSLTNTCQQRAISRLSINIARIYKHPFLLMPRVQLLGGDGDGNYQFRVRPPLGAPDDSAIIPPGATLKFNTTVMPGKSYNITVIAAAFSS